MTGLPQAFDDIRLVGVAGLPQLTERRQEARVLRGLGVNRS